MVAGFKVSAFWGKWLDGTLAPDTSLAGWPIHDWGRLGKILEFTGGLSAVLDLMGEERVDRWHEAATRQFSRAAAAARTQFDDAVRPWRARVRSMAWVTVPIACVANFVVNYSLELHLAHFGKAFTLVTAAILGLSFGVIFTLWADEKIPHPVQLYSGPIGIIYYVGVFRYGVGMRLIEHPPWWIKGAFFLALLALIILTAAISALFYFGIMSTLLLLELSTRYGVTLAVVTLTTALSWALHNKARPLRWLAFILILIGFHFDLLSG